jgi:membrane associated rhomboid family serine protease
MRLEEMKKSAYVGGRPPRATLALLVLFALVFVVFVLSGSQRMPALIAFRWSLIWDHGELWRLFSCLFFFGPAQRVEILPALGGGVALWLFGGWLERWWGLRRFLVFFFVSAWGSVWTGGLLANAFWPAVATGGFAGGAVALVTAIGVMHLHHPVGMQVRGRFYALRGWHLLALLGAMFGLGLIVDVVDGRSPVRYFVYGAGAGIALLFIDDRWRPWIWWRRRRARRMAEKYGVTTFPGRKHGAGKGRGPADPSRWN